MHAVDKYTLKQPMMHICMVRPSVSWWRFW